MKYVQLFEKFIKENITIEEIEDYFLELSDHSTHEIPIIVSVTNHQINKSTDGRKKINGFKVTIIYDIHDQVYVENVVNSSLYRMKNIYKIYYNQISKMGNGYTTREIPVHGFDSTRTRTISDPKWKKTITLAPINKINESLVEEIEDILDITLEDDKIEYREAKFDILMKVNLYYQAKYKLIYGNVTNADILDFKSKRIEGSNPIHTIIDGLSIDMELPLYGNAEESFLKNKLFILNKFNSIIRRCTNVLIYMGEIRVPPSQLQTRKTILYNIVFIENPIKK